MHAETMDQLVSLPWRAVVLRHFEEEMRTTPKDTCCNNDTVRHDVYDRTCMTGFTMGEYESEERKRLKEENVLLMKSVRDLMIREGAEVACAKRRDALCFVRFLLEQILVLALKT